MKIHPQHREELETLHGYGSQRQITEMGSQVGIHQMSKNLLPLPNPKHQNLFKVKSMKNLYFFLLYSSIQLSSATTFSPTNSQRMGSRQLFCKMVRKVINVLHFINELRNYADQLKSQNVKYQYRKRNLLPFFPDDLVYILWGLLMNICTDIAAILFPLQVAFDFEGVVIQIIQALQIIFWLDLGMNFIICHISKELNLIYKIREVAFHYFSGWFVIDLISILPDFDYALPKLFKLLRLLRFFFYERRVAYNQSLDLLKQQKLPKDELIVKSEYNLDLRIKRLFKIFLEMIVLNHLFACLWHWVCRFNPGTNWIDYHDLSQESDYTLTVDQFYWAYQTITVIGYGDIEARNFDEYLLCILWMLVGVGYYSFTIGNITFILIQSNPNQEFDDQLTLFDEISQGMPSSVEQSLLGYLNYNIQKNPFWGDNAKFILSELPHQLALYLIAAVYKEILIIVPFMSNDINFSAAVLPNSTLAFYKQYETIYHIGQNANDFYFLIKGDVRLCDANGEAIIRVMEGTCFGEIESIEQTQRCWSAHALQDSIVVMCSSDYFSQFLQNESHQFFELQQMYKRRKIVLFEQAKLKRQQINKLRRGHAVDENSFNRKNTLSEQLDEFKKKTDIRPYHSVQQDLMLQIVGQKQARKQIIHEKFSNAVNRVKYLVQRSKRCKRLSVNDEDYRLIRMLINNRVINSTWSKQISKKLGRKLLSNFIKECDTEDLIKQFLLKAKQESIDRIARKKLVHIMRNICTWKREYKVSYNKIDSFYSQFHQQIYDSVKLERQEERKRIKQKQEFHKSQFLLKTKILSFNRGYGELEKLQTQLSLAQFEINQHEFEIDGLVTQIKQLLIFIN